MKMDDTSKQHSFGSGAQRNSHPRPFFYVQPPSQPYYLQWQLNNPYSHYGLPGGFNIGRPCMHPYPFVPYPGFVLPHAPIYPVDYRRMFEPRFHTPWGDVPRQQHHSQPYGRRETACSEAQTDPSEAIAKLIECLDKIRATEQVAERELDSGVASQSSSVLSPGEKNEEHGHGLPSALQDSLESPAMTTNDPTVVMHDESGQVIVDPLSPDGCWKGRLEDELPIDSSSIHEERPELERSASNQHLVPREKEEVTDIQSNISVTDSSVSRCDAEESTQVLSFPCSQMAQKEAKSENKAPKEGHLCDDANADQSCHILKLPFDVLTPGAVEADHLSSTAAPYYYNYLSMQTTHERMSVLSPSLDELSSRDEMFSTDLDDADLLPKHVYTGRRHAEVLCRSPQDAEEEAWLPDSKRSMCACCGKNLAKGTSRSKSNSSKMYQDEAGDSEEEGRYGRGCKEQVRVVVRKHSAPKKAHYFPPRHVAKPWYKRGKYKEPSDPVEKEEDPVCKQDAAEGDTGAGLELDTRELQCRTCEDKFCREDLTTADQGRWADGDVTPRRRQAAALQRQEMSNQWKMMYHRPREDHDDDEPPELQWDRDMAAATSTLQHSYGLGPRGPNHMVGAESPRGPHQATPVSSGPPRPDGPHQKPFFYVQSSQPYLPLQWPVPMPVSYNPYYGYPGLGYGLPVMPHYQPNPYIEPPGFVVPHTHLHLMDYRRILNPQCYQTMAYHARRFRYQHHSAPREMTNSEVQTEPLAAAHKTGTLSSDYIGEKSSSIAAQMLSSALAKQKISRPPEPQNMTPSSTSNASLKGSFVIQTEEVRIQCCTTPAGLQLLHGHETAEMPHSFSQDMVQCNAKLQDNQLHISADYSKQAPKVSSDIVFAEVPNTAPVPEDSENRTTPVIPAYNLRSKVAACDKTDDIGADGDLGTTSKNFHLDVVHLPFDPKYPDDLRKFESTVWSVEEVLSPSTESLIQSSSMKTYKNALTSLAEEAALQIQMLRQEVPAKGMIPQTVTLPLTENELDNVHTVESLGDEMASEAPYPTSGDTKMSEMTDTAEVSLTPNMMGFDNSPILISKNHHKRQTDIQEQQDTSFESLPAYLPSTSWFSDFENFYNKIPPAPTKQRRPLSNRGLDVAGRRRKLELDYKEMPNVHKPKEKYKPKGKVVRQSLSDHECCVSRNFNENLYNPYVSKTERLCSRCLAKHGVCTSPSKGCNGRSLKRKAVPLQQWNDTLLPTCDECKSHTNKQLMRNSSHLDIWTAQYGHDGEGESTGNASCHMGPKRRATDDTRKFADPKKLLASKQNVNKCPVVLHPKLMEKKCVCNELQHQRLHYSPRGNTIQELGENGAMPVSFHNKQRIMDHVCLKHSWYTGKSLKDATTNADHEGSTNAARSLHLNKHKKSQPQQGTFTKDSRF